MGMPSHPFATETAARIYAVGRPDYSSLVTDIIRGLAHIAQPVPCAVDVGSGTGISTMALAPLAETVIGVEPSPAMLEHARQRQNVEYRLGSAEHLPAADHSCDLIGVGSALHWFARESFLSEASRVARPGAWLVIHDHWFMGQIEGNEEFGEWVRNVYLDKYPSPPRDRSWRPPNDLGMWRHVAWEQYEHRIQFDQDELAAYLLTQSNLQAVIERGDDTVESLRAWLRSQTGRFFADRRPPTFLFGGFVACHRESP